MAEYIEREATLKIVTDMMCDCKVTHKGRAIRRNIKQLPVADVVEVVRCKDCEYFKSIDYNLNKCEEHSDGWGDHTVYVGEDDYCSFGVRKEGAEE